jgi:hypothetical protein
MDFWGPKPQYSADGNKCVVATPLRNNTAITTARCFMEQFVFKYGVSRRLINDQGVHFNNELIKNLTELLGTNHRFSTPIEWIGREVYWYISSPVSETMQC